MELGLFFNIHKTNAGEGSCFWIVSQSKKYLSTCVRDKNECFYLGVSRFAATGFPLYLLWPLRWAGTRPAPTYGPQKDAAPIPNAIPAQPIIDRNQDIYI